MSPRVPHTRKSVAANIWKSGRCWLWMPPGFQGTYKSAPKIMFNGHLQRVSRMVWLYEGNTLDEYQYLQRTCREISCVNPGHYTRKSNLLAGYGVAAINAVKTHCVHGHPLSGSNLYTAPSSGQRKCRKCMKARQLKQRDLVDSVRVLDSPRYPIKENLARLLAAGVSYAALARDYGISDVAVRYWAKKWGLGSRVGKAKGSVDPS